MTYEDAIAWCRTAGVRRVMTALSDGRIRIELSIGYETVIEDAGQGGVRDAVVGAVLRLRDDMAAFGVPVSTRPMLACEAPPSSRAS